MGRTSGSARAAADLTRRKWAWSWAARSKSRSGGGLLALGGELGEEGFAVGGEEGLDRGGLGGVGGRALGRAGLVAGREALVHLTVDAAGMLGIRREVLGAAAELEEVEDGVAVAVGGGARRKGAVGVGERAAAETVGGVDARKGVLGGEAQEEGRVQTQAAAGFGLREDADGRVVERERGLELGAGDGEVDAGNAVAQVEALGLGVGRGEDAGDAAAEVGGAGEVGLGLRLAFDCVGRGGRRLRAARGWRAGFRRSSRARRGWSARSGRTRPQEDCRAFARLFVASRGPPVGRHGLSRNSTHPAGDPRNDSPERTNYRRWSCHRCGGWGRRWRCGRRGRCRWRRCFCTSP